MRYFGRFQEDNILHCLMKSDIILLSKMMELWSLSSENKEKNKSLKKSLSES